MLRIGLPKGVVKQKSMSLIEQLVGSPINRKKLFHTDGRHFEFFLLKHRDIPHLLENGELDVGITSTEWILERRIPLHVLTELDWCDTRISLIGTRNGKDRKSDKPLRCVTEFPNITKAYLEEAALQHNVTLVNLSGSSEGLVPHVFDCCVDCVETGETLAEHDLVEWKTIVESKIVVVCKQPKPNGDSRLDVVLNVLRGGEL